jgi:hypothetical protein
MIFRRAERLDLRELRKNNRAKLIELLRDSTISQHLDYAYLPISKAANTFLKRLLWQVEHENGFARALDDNYFSIHNIGWKYASDEESPWMPIEKGMVKEFQQAWGKQKFRFSVVRNPFTRLLSAYLDKIGGQKEKSKQNLFRHLNSVPNFDPLSLSFEAFVDIVVATRDSHLNKHWLPQINCLAPDYISCNYIGHFENMDEILDRLRAHFPQNAQSIQNMNTAVHKTNSSSLAQEYYKDEKIIKKVYRRFRDDFELLGYGRDPLNIEPVKNISKDLLKR